jgi:ankyrin repeat protein
MLQKQFTKGSAYFPLRNYKYETVFHIAAKNNAKVSLEFICGRSVFIQQLLKRDYKGDTPIHAAAKAGSYETLEFLC